MPQRNRLPGIEFHALFFELFGNMPRDGEIHVVAANEQMVADRLPSQLQLAVFFGYYLPRKERVEPERLREAHGDAYAAYYDAVPALLPRWTAWPGASNDGWYSSRLRRNREHWMLLGVTAITWLLMWRAY